ncbi:hypothetical protein [Haloferula sargassicola]|uniref:hypothetical protein n=1 Tax=Haloferula sargassicola TaxID=490096 RepID=UPI0033653DA9
MRKGLGSKKRRLSSSDQALSHDPLRSDLLYTCDNVGNAELKEQFVLASPPRGVSYLLGAFSFFGYNSAIMEKECADVVLGIFQVFGGLITATVGAGAGAYFAFKLSRDQQKQEAKAQNFAASVVALYSLEDRHLWFLGFQKEFIRPHAGKDEIWSEWRDRPIPASPHLETITIKNVAFLSEDPSNSVLLHRLSLEQSNLLMFKEMLNRRNFLAAELQEKMKQSGSVAQLTRDLHTHNEELVRHVIEGIEASDVLHRSLRSAIDSYFPGSEIPALDKTVVLEREKWLTSLDGV